MAERTIFDQFTGGGDASRVASKEKFGAYYDAINRQLNASKYKDWSLFLNFGYVSDGTEQRAKLQIPRHFPNRNSAQMVLELIGDRRIDGTRILDVGCGRGGLLSILDMYFKPLSLTGVDLSSEAIQFARKSHLDSRFDFQQGDAERLPRADGTFDVVTNVESSHSYPEIRMFYSEVSRVLVPHGWFLYADVLSRDAWESSRAALAELGFSLTRDTDITGNVLKSCDEIAAQRLRAFPGWNEESGEFVHIREFLGVSDSFVYKNMIDRTYEYRICWLQRA